MRASTHHKTFVNSDKPYWKNGKTFPREQLLQKCYPCTGNAKAWLVNVEAIPDIEHEIFEIAPDDAFYTLTDSFIDTLSWNLVHVLQLFQ